MLRNRGTFVAALLAAGSLICAAPALAQYSAEDGTLDIHVKPKQAYVFVDGRAIRDGSQKIELGAGKHEVGVYNYGYLAKKQEVSIGAGETTHLSVALQPTGDEVAGPFADIEFKGHPRAAVLLNGDTPKYFVGHVDEFNWDWIWHQRLLVHSGTYHVDVTRDGNTIWSGDITAKAGQKVIVHLNDNGRTETKEWKAGLNMAAQPRFHAGIASATVPPAPVSARLMAQSKEIACGQSTDLKWRTRDAVAIKITKLGEVSPKGLRAVSPTANTTYVLTAVGPGGESRQSVAVDVNKRPEATLSLNEPEVYYHKIGDKVVEQDAAVLDWSAKNANSVMVEPFGSEALSGSQTVKANPTQKSDGPVNEDVKYTLTASNACGGTATKTATLHIVGSIDPPPAIKIVSLFYPTNYPLPRRPKVGLVSSEEMKLEKLADHFQNYTQYDQDAKLKIVGHADIRGSKPYNQKLSERRAEEVKDFLVARGVSPTIIETSAVGKTQQLAPEKVEALLKNETQKPEKWMLRNKNATWMAFNRRVDIVLEPSGKLSARIYPADAPNARLLWEKTEPSLSAMERASKLSASSGKETASLAGGAN
ncbi:MAG TPA: OmpA family protein [Candidatus Acidoferrum sp.]|nr:OmpA family protein [Candidatus Acidoferrum sp.]